MKPRNLYIYKGDLVALKEEYDWMGRDCELRKDCLVVYAVRRKPEPKAAPKNKEYSWTA